MQKFSQILLLIEPLNNLKTSLIHEFAYLLLLLFF